MSTPYNRMRLGGKVNKFKSLIQFAVAIWLQVRPSIINRIVLVVVIGGMTIAAGNLWQPVMADQIKRHLGTDIKLDTDPWIGVTIVAVGLVFAFATNAVTSFNLAKVTDRRREADRMVFERYKEILNEKFMRDWINDLWGAHKTTSENLYKLKHLNDELLLSHNRFFEPDLQKKSENFQEKSENLLRFIFREFFDLKGQHTQSTFLRPDYNIDRGMPTPTEMKIYDNLTNELNELIDQFEAAYKKFFEHASRCLV